MTCTQKGTHIPKFAPKRVHIRKVVYMSKYYKKQSISTDGEVVYEKTFKLYSPFKEGRGYNFKYKSLNVRSYFDIELPKCFTDSEIGKIHRLSRRIYSSSNLLARRSNNNIVPLTKKDIQGIVGLYRTKFYPFWNKIIDNKIIKPVMLDGSEYFCFNPIYFNTTTYLPLYLYITFQKELQDHLPKWAIEKYLEMQPKQEEKEVQ